VVVEQQISGLFAQRRDAHENGHDMRLRRHGGKAGLDQPTLAGGGALLVALAFGAAGLEVVDAGKRAGSDCRGQRGG